MQVYKARIECMAMMPRSRVWMETFVDYAKMATDKEELRWYNLNDLKGGRMDGVCGRFGVCGYPTFFIVSPDGVILDKLQGYRKGNIVSFVNDNI